MIRLENITKSYRLKGKRKYVFKDLSFTFPEDKNVAILGKNGAGKSTLLRLIGGTEMPDSGKIITNNRVSHPISLGGAIQSAMSGRDNIKFVCRLFGHTGLELKKKVEKLEEFIDIGEYFDEPVSTYSSGMAAKLKLATTFIFDFEYYLLDEILAVADPKLKEKSAEFFESEGTDSKIILVTHSFAIAKSMCDASLILKDGELKLYEDVKEAFNVYKTL